jgi:hypothetical protein
MKKSKKNFQKSGSKHGKARWGKALYDPAANQEP